MRNCNLRSVTLAIASGIAAFVFILTFASAKTNAEAVNFCGVPTVLPIATDISDGYSPPICLGYSGLQNKTYTLKVWLLEKQGSNPPCGNFEWCERIFTLDNTGGVNATGQITIVSAMSVFNYQAFLWVMRLYDGNTELDSDKGKFLSFQN